MRPSNFLVALVALTQGIHAVAISDAPSAAIDAPSQPESQYFDDTPENDLVKRKGGGGGGGRGGSSGSSGSSGGSRGGSSSSGGRGSSSSNSGGSTTTGSGRSPQYGGGSFYGGGAKVPYTAGTRSASGIAPVLLVGAGLGAVAFIGITWASGAYLYPYTNRYYYHNSTTNQNETKPVTCICEQYTVCSCDDNGNATYFNSVIGDGSYANLNRSLVTVADNATNNNESTIYILGNLPNGTTASGGTENPNSSTGMVEVLRIVGWWPVATAACALVFLL